MPEGPQPRRRTFGPVVLLGVLAGTAAAAAGTQPWFGPDGSLDAGDSGFESELALTFGGGDVPAVNAMALVGLACWGVVLVTGGRFRRYVAVLGLLAAVGLVVAVVNAWVTVPDSLVASFEAVGLTDREVNSTGWSWIGSAAAVVGLVTWLAAVRYVQHWPEMGRRYDTPADNPPEDLWKAMDQGHDPTS